VDGAVDHVARDVDAVIGVWLPNDVALQVDLHQARRGDFLIKQAIEVDEQVLGAGNTSGDMIVDEIRHSVVVDQPVAGGEVDPGLPFLRRDIVADRSEVGRIVHGHFLWRSA